MNIRLLQRWPRAPRTTVVAVLDRDDWSACTDNIVVVDAERRTLTWVPRDLWSWRCAARINAAFARGGHPLLQAALAELGLPVASSLVLRRCAVERALATLRITVPVPRTRRYWYPLAPRQRLEDGARLVTFAAPQETLEGERLHQWLGARRSADRPAPPLPDLDRIQRQQVLVRRLLEERFAFAAVLEDPGAAAISDPEPLELLARVRADWRMRTLDRVAPFLCEGQQALRLRSPLSHALRTLLHRLRLRLRLRGLLRGLRPRSEA
ncbi:MAG: hypothetical protein VKO65_04720 [Cyanobacteriota bacterium]|nr:hypothetical protein [Cyanobacteriota bacterium]